MSNKKIATLPTKAHATMTIATAMKTEKAPATTTTPATTMMPVATTAAAQAPVTSYDAIGDAINSYQQLFDTLGRAYWDATDMHSKDTIQGTREAVYEILTGLSRAKLEANATAYKALLPKIEHANKALEEIKEDIRTITKNINTAASVIEAISKVLAVAAKL
ncbi:MAG: hypothetical protein PW789_16045 [Edaphobacter sp.]|uniref:hypothetical protein n=1 Tax=Edaphobacter sp. TaxID=1934404 RepID=UPI00239B5DE2|nr:hypothetical protein [Edaphobacter sp.]MDE1178089.1 hypothetical protein [Edaphobacter sp.]